MPTAACSLCANFQSVMPFSYHQLSATYCRMLIIGSGEAYVYKLGNVMLLTSSSASRSSISPICKSYQLVQNA
jgi:hypothetical protein